MFLRWRLSDDGLGLLALTGILLLIPFSATAQTGAGGVIDTNSVWSAAVDPFIVTQSVVVAGNAILTIEAGVEVRFEPDATLSVSNGTLVARGTVAETIIFTANATPPDADTNRWGCIEFAPGAVDAAFTPGGAYFEGCILEHAVLRFGGGTDLEGVIHVEKSHPYLADNLIESNATGGVYFNNQDSPGAVLLTRNTIRHNLSPGDGGGVCLVGCSSVVMSDNTVCDNAAVGEGGGVYAQECLGAVLTNNTVCDNDSGQDGGGVAVRFSPDARLIGNRITGNEGTPGGGVGITSSRAVQLVGNWLLENQSTGSGGGVSISSSQDNVLTGNSIVSNSTGAAGAGGAVYAVSSGDLWMSGNTVTLNTAGAVSGRGGGGLYVLYGGTTYLHEDEFLSNASTGRGGGLCFVQIGGCEFNSCVITGNTASAGGELSVEELIAGFAPDVVLSSDLLNPSRIGGNVQYDIYNGLAYGGPPVPDGPGNIDARHVWWETANRSIISLAIYDHSDDAARGYVVFSPYAVPVSPTPAIFRSLAVSQNQYQLSFTNVVDGNICTVERSLDLLSEDWVPFTNIVAGSSPVIFSWAEVETNEAAFYRIQSTDWGLVW